MRESSGIIQAIENDLNLFKNKLQEYVYKQNGFIKEMTEYVLSQKGKYIRPIMVYSTARMFGEVNQTCHNGAVLLELVHTATLVHDDVVDEADLRRGKPSVNAVWENKRAILVGDYLFAKAMKIATESREYKLFDIISPTVLNMSIGELIQLNSSIQNDFTEDTYYEIIQNKTASLISTCCKVGSYAAGTDEVAQKIMAEFGFNAGMAFQIKDDIFDYTRNNKTGKTEGNDIVERKATLPLIGALKNSSGRKKENLLQYWKNGKDVEYIKNLAFDFVHENGGIEYSEKVMQKYHNKALQTIAAFDDSEAKTAMIELLDFIVKRKN
jgi:octaprenyl-diphosphate synthase